MTARMKSYPTGALRENRFPGSMSQDGTDGP